MGGWGRTGRMGREGTAYTFVTPEEGTQLTNIEMRINRILKRDEIEGFEPHPERSPDGDAQAPEPVTKPVFGRRVRRHSRRLSVPPLAPGG